MENSLHQGSSQRLNGRIGVSQYYPNGNRPISLISGSEAEDIAEAMRKEKELSFESAKKIANILKKIPPFSSIVKAKGISHFAQFIRQAQFEEHSQFDSLIFEHKPPTASSALSSNSSQENTTQAAASIQQPSHNTSFQQQFLLFCSNQQQQQTYSQRQLISAQLPFIVLLQGTVAFQEIPKGAPDKPMLDSNFTVPSANKIQQGRAAFNFPSPSHYAQDHKNIQIPSISEDCVAERSLTASSARRQGIMNLNEFVLRKTETLTSELSRSSLDNNNSNQVVENQTNSQQQQLQQIQQSMSNNSNNINNNKSITRSSKRMQAQSPPPCINIIDIVNEIPQAEQSNPLITSLPLTEEDSKGVNSQSKLPAPPLNRNNNLPSASSSPKNQQQQQQQLQQHSKQAQASQLPFGLGNTQSSQQSQQSPKHGMSKSIQRAPIVGVKLGLRLLQNTNSVKSMAPFSGERREAFASQFFYPVSTIGNDLPSVGKIHQEWRLVTREPNTILLRFKLSEYEALLRDAGLDLETTQKLRIVTQILNQLPLFKVNSIHNLAHISKRISYTKHEFLYRIHEKQKGLYYILEGEVSIQIPSISTATPSINNSKHTSFSLNSRSTQNNTRSNTNSSKNLKQIPDSNCFDSLFKKPNKHQRNTLVEVGFFSQGSLVGLEDLILNRTRSSTLQARTTQVEVIYFPLSSTDIFYYIEDEIKHEIPHIAELQVQLREMRVQHSQKTLSDPSLNGTALQSKSSSQTTLNTNNNKTKEQQQQQKSISQNSLPSQQEQQISQQQQQKLLSAHKISQHPKLDLNTFRQSFTKMSNDYGQTQQSKQQSLSPNKAEDSNYKNNNNRISSPASQPYAWDDVQNSLNYASRSEAAFKVSKSSPEKRSTNVREPSPIILIDHDVNSSQTAPPDVLSYYNKRTSGFAPQSICSDPEEVSRITNKQQQLKQLQSSPTTSQTFREREHLEKSHSPNRSSHESPNNNKEQQLQHQQRQSQQLPTIIILKQTTHHQPLIDGTSKQHPSYALPAAAEPPPTLTPAEFSNKSIRESVSSSKGSSQKSASWKEKQKKKLASQSPQVQPGQQSPPSAGKHIHTSAEDSEIEVLTPTNHKHGLTSILSRPRTATFVSNQNNTTATQLTPSQPSTHAINGRFSSAKLAGTSKKSNQQGATYVLCSNTGSSPINNNTAVTAQQIHGQISENQSFLVVPVPEQQMRVSRTAGTAGQPQEEFQMQPQVRTVLQLSKRSRSQTPSIPLLLQQKQQQLLQQQSQQQQQHPSNQQQQQINALQELIEKQTQQQSRVRPQVQQTTSNICSQDSQYYNESTGKKRVSTSPLITQQYENFLSQPIATMASTTIGSRMLSATKIRVKTAMNSSRMKHDVKPSTSNSSRQNRALSSSACGGGIIPTATNTSFLQGDPSTTYRTTTTTSNTALVGDRSRQRTSTNFRSSSSNSNCVVPHSKDTQLINTTTVTTSTIQQEQSQLQHTSQLIEQSTMHTSNNSQQIPQESTPSLEAHISCDEFVRSKFEETDDKVSQQIAMKRKLMERLQEISGNCAPEYPAKIKNIFPKEVFEREADINIRIQEERRIEEAQSENALSKMYLANTKYASTASDAAPSLPVILIDQYQKTQIRFFHKNRKFAGVTKEESTESGQYPSHCLKVQPSSAVKNNKRKLKNSRKEQLPYFNLTFHL